MLKEYKIIKEKHWRNRWIRIYQNETGAFLVLEEDDKDETIISASFHFFWKEALKEFNRRKRDDSYRESKKNI